MDAVKYTSHKKNSVVDKNLMDRIYRLSSKDADLILILVGYYLEEMEGLNIHKVNIEDLVNLMDRRISTVENKIWE